MNSPEGYPHKRYLGDGAYVQQGNYIGEVVLTTEDGISVQNRVVLGPHEIRMMDNWLKEVGEINKAYLEKSE